MLSSFLYGCRSRKPMTFPKTTREANVHATAMLDLHEFDWKYAGFQVRDMNETEGKEVKEVETKENPFLMMIEKKEFNVRYEDADKNGYYEHRKPFYRKNPKKKQIRPKRRFDYHGYTRA